MLRSSKRAQFLLHVCGAFFICPYRFFFLRAFARFFSINTQKAAGFRNRFAC
jgi:hypothetical protein